MDQTVTTPAVTAPRGADVAVHARVLREAAATVAEGSRRLAPLLGERGSPVAWLTPEAGKPLAAILLKAAVDIERTGSATGHRSAIELAGVLRSFELDSPQAVR